MGKIQRYLLVHVLVSIVYATSPPLTAQPSLFRAQHLVLRMLTARSVAQATALLPPGYSIESQLLAPEQSVYFSPMVRDASLLQAPSTPNVALYSAEDRLTRTFTVLIDSTLEPLREASRLRVKFANVVEFAEPWYVASMQEAPNDPDIASQGYLVTIKAHPAWALYRGDTSVVIGISDNGVSQLHEDLRPNIAPNHGELPNNGIDDDQNGYIDDYIGYNFTSALDNTLPGNTFNSSNGGHGTEVAGLAAAASNNGIGMLGIGFLSRFFPMKTATLGGDGIIYGYQSLIYAAQRKFKVVNTSWGIPKPPSPIDQSVIDYCVANDVLVVASAGNHGDGTAGKGWLQLNFPAAYDGVLGVGETDEADIVQFSSGLGLNAGVMAPGRNAYTTDISGGYTSFGIIGTSFASPMAAGLAGVLRGRYPQLSARQTLAHIRHTADDIAFRNRDYAHVLPGRINMQRAIEQDPFATPSVRISNVYKKYYDGRPADRFFPGDTLYITMDLVNDLARVTNLSARLTVAEENGWTIRIIRDSAMVDVLYTNERKTTTAFLVVIEVISADRPLVFALELKAESYVDRALWYLNRPSFMTVFENNQLVYSMGDDGTVGYNSSSSTRQGVGFGWKGGFSLLSPSGCIVVEGNNKSLSAYAGDPPYVSSFATVKPFSAPNENTNVMTDNNVVGQDKIGVRVTQTCTFPGPDVAATVVSVRLQNESGRDLVDVSSGYFLDWDIGSQGVNNSSRLAPEAIPANLRGQNAVAQVFTRPDHNVAVCYAVYSATPGGIAQSAAEPLATRVDDADGLTTADLVALLTSGSSIQVATRGDLCGTVGMLFRGPLAQGNSVAYIVVIGVGATEAEAAQVVRQTLTSSTDVALRADHVAVLVAPHPASERMTIVGTEAVQTIELLDITGRLVFSQQVDGATSSTIDVSRLLSGSYVLRLQAFDHVVVRTVLVLR